MPKKQDNTLENRRRFRAIQRLCNRFPPQTADERLEQIAGIASRELPPEVAIQPVSEDLAERLAAGAASRSPRVGQKPKTEPEKVEEPEPTGKPGEGEPEGDGKKRKAKKERDRREGRGFNRTTDVNV